MNKEIKEEWAQLAESGKHNKCIGELKYANNRCVLGLLCEVYIKHNPTATWDEEGPLFVKGDYVELPSPAILKWAGLSQGQAVIIGKKNDHSNQSLPQLADSIRRVETLWL